MKICTVDEANGVTVEWVREHVDVEAARRLDSLFRPPSNGEKPFRFHMPPLGAWKVDRFGEAAVLVVIPVAQMKPLEGELDHARRLPTTKLYAQWMRAGLAPPPPYVVESDKGTLLVHNRRRWLAAQLAGVDSLLCWYSAAHDDYIVHGRWYMPEHSEPLLAKWERVRLRSDARDYFDAYQWESLQRYAEGQR